MVLVHNFSSAQKTKNQRSFFQGSFFLFLFPIFLAHAADSPLPRVIHVQQTKRYGVTGQQYVLHINGQRAGMLNSIQIPLVHWCIFYDFFIQAGYRGHGHGHYLFAQAIEHAKKAGAVKMIVQPGPFELVDGRFVSVTGTARTHSLQRLIQFYTVHHFKRMQGMTLRCVAWFLAIVYRLAGIKEDPRFLMTYTCTG